MYEPNDIISDEAALREVIPGTFASQTAKIIDHIDDHIRVWIEHSPFVTMATYGPDGAVDVSPKGDPAGFVKVVDEKTLAIPDRPGNHRFDGFLNIIATGRIGLMFMVPNRREVVRVNGSAVIVRDPELRESMAIKGRVPDFAVVVRVEEAFYHCGKAVLRADLWQPQNALPVDGLPTYAEALKVHGRLEDPIEDLEARMRRNEELRLYDE